MEKVVGCRVGLGQRGSFRSRRFILRLPLTVLALSCLQLPNTDSETSYHTSWRLDPGQGKVMPSVGSYLNLPQPPVNARPPSDSHLSPHHHTRILQERSNNIGVGSKNSGEDTNGEDISDRDFMKLQEEVLQILLSTEPTPDGTWKKTENSSKYCSRCPRPAGGGTDPTSIHSRQPLQSGDDVSGVLRNNRGLPIIGVQGAPRPPESAASDGVENNSDDVYTEPGHNNGQSNDLMKEDILDCGKPVNFTYYDHLVGIQNRANHIHIPEPEVALTFQNGKHGHFGGGSAAHKSHKSSGDGSKNGSNGLSRKSGAASEVNIDAIEKRLKRAKREKPKSVELYNQIGNFWRIRGDTQKSIECFRRALAVSPNNADILLNLGRVLFNLNYLDDAIFLTRRSLEVQPPDQNAWAQHFQLGEILKAYCHYQEAALHLRHVLELKPNYQPALSALTDMESMPDSTVHIYTVFIIVFLVLAVLIWILSTLDISLEELLGFSSSSKSSSSSDPTNGIISNGSSHQNSSRSFSRLQRFHSRNGKRFT